jgi:hypothetical protein
VNNGDYDFLEIEGMSIGCIFCEILAGEFFKENPHKKGAVLCEKCIEDLGIVPINLACDQLPKETESDNTVIYL